MKKEIKIALVAIIALVALFFGMNFLKGAKTFSDDNRYYITFKNIEGISKNCPVYAEGVVVGSITDISYDYSHKKPTSLTALLNKKLIVPEGTVAEIHSDLMGNTQVNLILGNYSNPSVAPGGTIKGNDGDDTMAKLKSMVPTIEDIVPKLDSVVANLNLILSDPAVHTILCNTGKLTANMDEASANLNSLVTELNNDLPSIMEQASRMLENGGKITDDLASANITGTIEHANQTLNDLQAAITKINSQEGTLGKIINDTSLYDNLNAAMADADSLMIDLRMHPKRYVHFSVFGKKN